MPFGFVISIDPALMSLIKAFKFDYASRITRLEQLVSQLSDAIAAANSSADAAIARVQGDVTSLQTQIAALQAQVNQGGASAADLQALADLQAKLDALDPTQEATLPA